MGDLEKMFLEEGEELDEKTRRWRDYAYDYGYEDPECGGNFNYGEYGNEYGEEGRGEYEEEEDEEDE